MKIFISAVTSEFGKARDAVASDLRARSHTVRVQSDFQQGPDGQTLLGRLADYIRDCHAVICIVGKQCGACPSALAAERYAAALPEGIKEASYTQWEFLLADHFKRRPYLYIARDDYEPDKDPASTDRADLQSTFREFLKAKGVHYTGFADANELRIAVMRDEPKIAAEPAPVGQAKSKPIMLPYPSIGDLFKGRDEFMQRLHDSLTRTRGGRTAIVSQALYGLGGIGKTRAAVEYAWAHAEEYNALLFVVAETPEALLRNLAALSGALLPQLDTTDDAVRLAAVLDWLKANPGWFLILDNVDSKEALTEVERFLRDLVDGHLVVTGRLANFSGHFHPLELDVLAIEDSVAFLLARTEGRRRAAADDAAKAREVADELGQLALALEQAAAFIAKRRLTFTQYLEEWRSNRDEVLKWFDETVTGYRHSVAVTWQTSIAQLSDGGRRLLERLAWLSSEELPEAIIDVPIPGEGENQRDAFDDLAAYSLVTRDVGPFFHIHRLVRDVTLRSLPGKAKLRSLAEALCWSDPVDLPQYLGMRWNLIEFIGPHLTTGDPVFRLLMAIGGMKSPLPPSGFDEIFGQDDPEIATYLIKIAEFLKSEGAKNAAEELMRRAVAILVNFTCRTGHRHPHLDAAVVNYARLLVAMGKSKKKIKDACAALMQPLSGGAASVPTIAGEGGRPKGDGGGRRRRRNKIVPG